MQMFNESINCMGADYTKIFAHLYLHTNNKFVTQYPNHKWNSQVFRMHLKCTLCYRMVLD